MTFVSRFSLVVGVGMILQWAFFIVTGNVPELQSEPIRIAFHLAAEGATALALILSGLMLRQKRRHARHVTTCALGMLAYTVIVSPGYFAQMGQWPLVVMFVALLVLDGVALWRLWKE